MDIYQQSISFLDEKAVFDENGLFQCELSSEDAQALFFNVFKNEETIQLHLSLISPVVLPTPLPDLLAVKIAEQALEPLRGGFGICLMPDSRRLTLFKVISLSGKPQGYVQDAFEQLLARMDQWHQFIEEIENSSTTAETPSNSLFI